jgi:UDP-N-acetylglucosamine--N-acetylmuramyl-(pentapeptide) pyrophosphoryl-undecaprenol N-acetylglucosamine transferase
MKVPVDAGEKKVRVMVAGGGTGGHLFPGLAVAGEIKKRCEGARILFVTGKRKMESEIIKRSGFDQASISRGGDERQGLERRPCPFETALELFPVPGHHA